MPTTAYCVNVGYDRGRLFTEEDLKIVPVAISHFSNKCVIFEGGKKATAMGKDCSFFEKEECAKEFLRTCLVDMIGEYSKILMHMRLLLREEV